MTKETKSTTVTVRVAPDVKRQVSELYKTRYGLTLTDAITLFFHQTISDGGFPFELKGKDTSASDAGPNGN